MKQLSIILLTLGLAACGGGGGSTSTASSDAKDTTTSSTPMSTLVAPAEMKWVTTTEPTLQFSVKDALGAAAPGALVALFTFSTTDPSDGSTLEEPVAMDPLDNAVTDDNGLVSFPVRLPAHLTQILVVSSLGAQTTKQVLDLSKVEASINLTIK